MIAKFKKAIFLVFTLGLNFSAISIALSNEDFKTLNKVDLSKKIQWIQSNQIQEKPNFRSSLIENSEIEINSFFISDGIRKNILHNKLALAKKEFSKEEIEIKSQIQTEENGILFAEGNVLATYRGYVLEADNLIYDKAKKIVKANGNISLFIGKQIFKMQSFEYDLNKKKGYLLKVKGLINTNNLIGITHLCISKKFPAFIH